jgi:hypothetical protein
MILNSKRVKYRKIISITEVGKSLYGKVLKFEVQHSDPILLKENQIIKYCTYNGEDKEDIVGSIKIGDFLKEDV